MAIACMLGAIGHDQTPLSSGIPSFSWGFLKRNPVELLKKGPMFPRASPSANFKRFDPHIHGPDLGTYRLFYRAYVVASFPAHAPPSRLLPDRHGLLYGLWLEGPFHGRPQIQGSYPPSKGGIDPEQHQKGSIHYWFGGQWQDGIRGPSPDGAFSKTQFLWGHSRLQTL